MRALYSDLSRWVPVAPRIEDFYGLKVKSPGESAALRRYDDGLSTNIYSVSWQRGRLRTQYLTRLFTFHSVDDAPCRTSRESIIGLETGDGT